ARWQVRGGSSCYGLCQTRDMGGSAAKTRVAVKSKLRKRSSSAFASAQWEPRWLARADSGLFDFCTNNAIDGPSRGSSYASAEGQCRFVGGSPAPSVGVVGYGLVAGAQTPVLRHRYYGARKKSTSISTHKFVARPN